ncbi:MAG: hypothetical protein IH606_12055 [Burkholderiales bacterium]|nr:hypothetical protein [Burkholderiales bacterium]
MSQVERPLTGDDQTQQHYSMELAEAVVAEYKLELNCADNLTDALAEAIAKAARAGRPDVGRIFISDTQSAIEIHRTTN